MQVQKTRWSAASNGPPLAVCTLCAQEIRVGERLWYRSGKTVCTDCFAQFAREEFEPFAYILGEERAE